MSDFRLFERPPKPGTALFRWIAWRWMIFGLVFVCFVGLFAAIHYIGGEPIYYTNENRNLTSNEARNMFLLFLSGGGLFFLLGLLGVLLIPRD